MKLLRDELFGTFAPAVELPDETQTGVRGVPVEGDVLPETVEPPKPRKAKPKPDGGHFYA